MLLKLILLITSFFWLIEPVQAGNPPTLSSPSDVSTVSSSRLEWQIPDYPLYSGNHYRIQVDDDPAFASINKDYNTDNNHYTPTLSLGNWNWRVKVKDQGGSWSDWSNIWSFILIEPTPTPSPTPTPTPAPTPTPTSIPTPTPTPTKTPSPSSAPKKTSSPTVSPISVITPASTPRVTLTPTISKTTRAASVAAVATIATPSASVLPIEVKNQKQINPLIWLGITLILLGTGSIGYIYKKRK